ncbi:bifunctional ADP-dependent NAD(P)H-hydrate dehydratase/NAD(P)H-hydrate epimerase [Corynebacterium sp. 153RC1]|uniref:bifunctional ADP-dependent NAD(P)H-hydrate dehydratase/NAD(P)H-hydrate epimerase n=1 Tax=unclassified Corynebacterium TaxID=2624378 RepID=UPI00211B80E0|nr:MULTISPECIES: bifunctional ADP-dependent NAD(P)H-hydrate dehydratase/NAD(P)H-hydrate epimerase [unclassified Corynebacterium]MCQ9352796.1 bifunctional ADP-dependent NAD(P)H-hydrate dehydratase/NAD(P)H-hydrate epimerase [Corynebacterium sp. 209RC1]MCQ9354980.1 bifunctional ADP-dependent NAD(P)H-hydrate dehydratase/NAD(P)H-hydrate epimerase [Corynebacterium sp. 1222RC1]MCQ9357241.1 bifunctional ADP-dependent NAD(P)H-hydrate dehydratase/NAD(P)H-hydrate epimerase [Corynebacterium sp. 122RC1]MCQ9
MQPAYLSSTIRAVETPMIEQSPPDFLMKQAAAHLAGELSALGGPTVFAVGGGGNGGDGLYAASILHSQGHDVEVVLIHPEGKAHPPAMAAYPGPIVTTPSWTNYVLVDAIQGLGSAPMDARTAALWGRLAASARRVVSVDIPTGIDADTGAGDGVRADLSVTFGGLRVAHALSNNCGTVRCHDISDAAGTALSAALRAHEAATQYVDLADGVAFPLPSLEPRVEDNKYAGVAGVVAGSPKYPGAAVLATYAAVQATSAMVRYVGPCSSEVLAWAPEVVATESFGEAGRCQAWVYGPGVSRHEASLMETELPLLIDASGLGFITPSDLSRRSAPTLITPHAGEYEALFGTQPVTEAAQETGTYILRKGRRTVIAAPDGFTWNINIGNSWLATPGSGDVLAGILGAYGARWGEWSLATIARGVQVHAVAAKLSAQTEFGEAPTSASRIARFIPAATAYCTS